MRFRLSLLWLVLHYTASIPGNDVADRIDDQGFPTPQDDFGASNPFASPMATPASTGQGFVTRSDGTLNPWTSMWTRPRETVRQQLETDPAKHVLLLSILSGIGGALGDADFVSEDIAMRIGILVGCLIGGALRGIFWLYLFGWLIGMTGRSLGGVADSVATRTALAWSCVPTVWLLPLNGAMAFLMAAMGPNALFDGITEGPPIPGGWGLPALSIVLIVVAVVAVFVTIWQFVIACKAVGEAHEFSAWRGLGAILLSGLAVLGFVMAIGLLILGMIAALGGF